jgi:hypothetical protein
VFKILVHLLVIKALNFTLLKMLSAFYEEKAEAEMLELCSELIGFWTLSIFMYSTNNSEYYTLLSELFKICWNCGLTITKTWI